MGSPEEPWEARVRLPQLRLDELLEELQARLDAARGTRDRVHSLLGGALGRQGTRSGAGTAQHRRGRRGAGGRRVRGPRCDRTGMEGLVDTRVPRETADHVVAVLSEALTNIARHAHADRADVALTADSRQVRLTVTDNGVGIPAGGRRSGLRNMAERARQLAGDLELSSPPDGGTTLVWWVPLPGEKVSHRG